MITEQQIRDMEPGRELDALVAEKVFGWRRIKGPKFDYEGPVESRDVLIPPTVIDEDEAFRMMPPKGAIPFYYFVNREYSKEISAAWEVVEMLQESYIYVDIRTCADFYEVWVTIPPFREDDQKNETFTSPKLPEAICKAALIAILRGGSGE